MMKSNLRSQMWRLAAVLLWVCGAMACAGNNPKPSSPFGDVAPPPNAQQALATMAPWLPEDTMAVAIVDVPFMVNMYRTSGIIPKEWDDTALRRDLGDFSKKRLGIDITKARWAAFAFSATPTSTGDEFAALFFEGDFGEPATLEERSFGSLKAYRVGEDDLGLIKTGKPNLVMYVFDRGPMEMVSALRDNAAQSLSQSPTQATMTRLLDATGSNRVVVVGQIPPSLSGDMEMMMGIKLPQAGAIAMGETTDVVIQGEPASLELVRTLVVEKRKELRAMLGQEMQNLDDLDIFEGMMLIMAYHLSDPLGEKLTPSIEGDLMSVQMGPEGLAVLGLAGSAFLIPFAVMGDMVGDMPVEAPPMEPQPVVPEPAPARVIEAAPPN